MTIILPNAKSLGVFHSFGGLGSTTKAGWKKKIFSPFGSVVTVHAATYLEIYLIIANPCRLGESRVLHNCALRCDCTAVDHLQIIIKSTRCSPHTRSAMMRAADVCKHKIMEKQRNIIGRPLVLKSADHFQSCRLPETTCTQMQAAQVLTLDVIIINIPHSAAHVLHAMHRFP